MVSKPSRRTHEDEYSEDDDIQTLPFEAGRFEAADPRARKPVIGVNMDFRSAREDFPAFSILSAGYYESITKAGGIPMAIPPLKDEDDLQRVLDLLDGVVLCGGADLDPRRDGFMLHPSQRLLDRRREEFDRMLVRLAAERRMPLLGIGCGMQLLNVSQGGSLFYHIPEDLPHALPHLDASDPNHRHALVVEKGSLMDRVYGESEIRVSSLHHMAVDDVAPDFAVTARCPDGVVEAIESTLDDWPALGVQFHPEEDRGTKLDVCVFEQFLLGIGRAGKLRRAA
jgi:putative glutamine amidotransferase